MRVPSSLLQELNDVVNALSSELQPVAKSMIDSIARNHVNEKGCIVPESVASFRADVVKAMDVLCSGATDIAASHAAGLYDEVRAIGAGDSSFRASADSRRIPAATDGAIRAFADSVVRTGAIDAFTEACAGRLDYEIRRAANECVAHNAQIDPLKPAYARVPTGAETCRFCMMLASHGFVYHDRDAVAHVHSNCDCRIVQGYEGMEIEGYDPDAWYRVWQRLENAETVAEKLYHGGPVAIQKEAAKLDKELNRQWANHKAIDSSAKAYRETYGRFVESKSIEGEITIEDFTKIEGKELQLATWLSGIDWDVGFRNPNDATRAGISTSDFFINDDRYEAKRISSSNPTKIAQRITDKVERQGPRFIIDLSCSKMTREESEAKIAWLLEDPRIDEILLIKAKTLKRFKK